MLKKFLYLDRPSLDGYVSALEDGLRTARTSTSASEKTRGGQVDARLAKGSMGSTGATGENRQFDDTESARFDRLVSLASADADETGWTELVTLGDLDGVGTGALVHFECEAHIPDMIRMLASGELESALEMFTAFAPLAEAFGEDLSDMPPSSEIEAVRDAAKLLKADLVMVGDDEDSDWRVAGKLQKEHLRDTEVEGFVRVVGKVSKSWPQGHWRPLMALPGASLLPRDQRRALERKAPDEDDKDQYLEGPAVMIDVLAIYR